MTPGWNPAPLTWLQERYHRAVDHVHPRGTSAVDGGESAHVFDCDDGVRVVVVRTETAVGSPVVSVAVEFRPGGGVARAFRAAVRRGEVPPGREYPALVTIAAARYAALAGKRAAAVALVPVSVTGEINLQGPDPDRR